MENGNRERGKRKERGEKAKKSAGFFRVAICIFPANRYS